MKKKAYIATVYRDANPGGQNWILENEEARGPKAAQKFLDKQYASKGGWDWAEIRDIDDRVMTIMYSR